MRGPAPGWWMLPGSLLGIVLWAVLAWAAWGLVIDADPGGGIVERVQRIERQKEAGERVEIRGVCASACTMHLSNACVWPDAVLIFHGPTRRSPPLSEADAARWAAVMARHYPPALAAWFMLEGRFGEWVMTGAGAIAAGARSCAGETS